ncbi:hypothetical protein E2562_019279 [Oryza meyeriana var. granulata]|uniref:Uncharacterized protein n=1 Tax=Oryza meyeriana var. granulata TaxID=110450 RepID=A0A6G1FAJ9_9ORYZ|nr:hypothetical protein E2562_019279 [Oryza meyeriana var. granulata]
MAFLAAASTRAPFALASSSRRRSVLATAVKATASSNQTAPHPVLSSLRLAASAAVLLAATTPAIACTPAPPPPALTVTVSPDDPITDDSHPFEKLIVETAALARLGGAEAARARLSAAGVGEQYARLLAAQALFVDGKVDDAIAAFKELARENPGDYRPLFCQGVLYSVLGRAAKSESMLQRCRELVGEEFTADFVMPVLPADTEVAEAEPESPEEEVEAEKL